MRNTHLSSPAEAKNSPFLDGTVALRLDLLESRSDLLTPCTKVGRASKVITKQFLLLRGVRWKPRVLGIMAVQEVGHVDLVLV